MSFLKFSYQNKILKHYLQVAEVLAAYHLW